MDRRRESSKQRRSASGSLAAGGDGSLAADGSVASAADGGGVAADGSLALGSLADASAAMQSVPVISEVPEVPHVGSADEQLDEMIAKMVPRSSHAVKSVVRTETTVPAADAALTTGLSPEQQGFLAQMADAMRRGQVFDDGAPALAALGDVGGGGTGKSGGSLLGALAEPLPPMVLRPPGLPAVQTSHPVTVPVALHPGRDGGVVHGALQDGSLEVGVPSQSSAAGVGTSRPAGGLPQADAAKVDAVVVVTGEHHALTPSAAVSEPNPFWSGGAGQGSGGHQTPQRSQGEVGPVAAGDGSLSHRDLLELEALKVQMFQEVEAKILEQMKKRSQSGSQQGSGSYHSASGGVGGGLGPASAVSFPMSPPLGAGGVGGAQASVGGEALTESLRMLELPKLAEGSSPLEFGDWLAVVGPLMSDLSGSSGYWWSLILDAAGQAYAQWAVSTPIERLRQRVVVPDEARRWPRTEQRAITMLLAAVPDVVRRELIATRKMSSVEALFALLCRYQPGGPSERAMLIKEISDNKLGSSAGVKDVLNHLRQWRRYAARARELHVQLPDALVLVHLLTTWADQLGRLGGAQVVYRLAVLRQTLQLDTVPQESHVMEYVEALQAEAEQLALTLSSTSSWTSPTASSEAKKKEAVKAAALTSGSGGGGYAGASETSKPRCKFWGTSVGCKRGAACNYEHSWEGMQKKGRCWNCSSDAHIKPDCPYERSEKPISPTSSSSEKTKVAKVGNPKSPKKKDAPGVSLESVPEAVTTSSPMTQSSSLVVPVEERPKAVIIEENAAAGSTSERLVADLTGLVKSLRSIKAVQLRYVEASLGKEQDTEPVALIDGGATHPLRCGAPEELEDAEAVSVELAFGSATLYKKKGCSTLLSKEPIEPILPVRMLINHGYKVSWTASSCVISHPTKGTLKSWRRHGCPVMKQDEALELLHEMEEAEMAQQLDDETVEFWRKWYPQVPREVLKFMKGQNGGGYVHQLPFNRHRRRQLETAKGVIVHLFAGTAVKWDDLRSTGYEVLCLDILKNDKEDLHNPSLWGYLCRLARLGKLKILVGGPPCRTLSRLRHRRPGPRPLRGRQQLRWKLPDLTDLEETLADGDSALILKMLGLYDIMVEFSTTPTAFLLEHPTDPADYVEKEELDRNDFPSIWEWEEVLSFAKRHQMKWIKCDQGAMGHCRRKPTTLLGNLSGLESLQELRQGHREGNDQQFLEVDLKTRMQQTASWACWAPRLVAAVKQPSRCLSVRHQASIACRCLIGGSMHVKTMCRTEEIAACACRRWVKTLHTAGKRWRALEIQST